MSWKTIEEAQREIAGLAQSATSDDDVRTVGLRCRELIISLAQEVFDAAHHLPAGSAAPSDTDSKAMLDAYLGSELHGSSHEDARRYVRATLQLANAVTHKRPADDFDAGLAAVATDSLVGLIRYIAGREPFAQAIPWVGVWVGERFFAWDGPTLHGLDDRPGISAPRDLIETIEEQGMAPSYGLREDLDHHFSNGKSQVFETDRVSWRREILHHGQVLLVRDARPGEAA